MLLVIMQQSVSLKSNLAFEASGAALWYKKKNLSEQKYEGKTEMLIDGQTTNEVEMEFK